MNAHTAPTPAAQVDSPSVAEHRIEHAHGALFARSWMPREVDAAASPIVLLHDSLGCVELWRDFPAQLAAASGRRVIAYDRLGFGRSAPRVGRPAASFVADEADMVPWLQDQLGFQRFVAFGHSVGGGIAVHWAARHADACEALVTESAQAFVEARTRQGIEAAREQFADPTQFARLQRYHGERAAWVLDAWVGTWLDPAFAGWSLREVLPAVRCPLLAIHGAADEFGSAQQPRTLVEHCGGPARMALLDGVGHVPHRECAARVLELVTEQLAPAASGRRAQP